MVEVGGEACLYVDPRNPKDMAKGLGDVVNSKKITNDLIMKGKERLRFFSWKKCAKETLNIYHKVLGHV